MCAGQSGRWWEFLILTFERCYFAAECAEELPGARPFEPGRGGWFVPQPSQSAVLRGIDCELRTVQFSGVAVRPTQGGSEGFVRRWVFNAVRCSDHALTLRFSLQAESKTVPPTRRAPAVPELSMFPPTALYSRTIQETSLPSLTSTFPAPSVTPKKVPQVLKVRSGELLPVGFGKARNWTVLCRRLLQIRLRCHLETSLLLSGTATTKVRRCQCRTTENSTVITSTRGRIPGTHTISSIPRRRITTGRVLSGFLPCLFWRRNNFPVPEPFTTTIITTTRWPSIRVFCFQGRVWRHSMERMLGRHRMQLVFTKPVTLIPISSLLIRLIRRCPVSLYISLS